MVTYCNQQQYKTNVTGQKHLAVKKQFALQVSRPMPDYMIPASVRNPHYRFALMTGNASYKGSMTVTT